ncbi:MAG: hypothetical protein A2Z83_07565 [Omnitrophica bacterium GWA2_52_8]|nr:MAG: hypothetical protein A2Z83_07565 [Omnitrophica bacterium GWA2_52_8]
MTLAILIVLGLFISPMMGNAYWVWSPEKGEFVNPEGEGKNAAEHLYDYAMQFFNEKNWDEAIKQFESLLAKYPSAPISSEAQYRLGIVYEEKSDYFKAFEVYKKLVESYPQSERFNEVIEREFRIGNLFLSGQKAKFMGVAILPALPKAIEVFQHIAKNAPYGEFGDRAQFHLGVAYKEAKQFENSVEAFQALIDQYPQSELVPQARYQIAESSYMRSSREFRDQRALDDAMKQVDRFLTHHPDSPTSEKAARIRQVIDEKNAEKNYSIGQYYEKSDYLHSAIIYYSDVAARYPHTKWGEKSAQRLKALEDPSAYHAQMDKEIDGTIKSLETELASLDKKADPKQYEEVSDKMERLKDRRNEIEKQKTGTLESRKQDIDRRERELKEKFKRLEKKQKLMGNNPSADFKNAMDRWYVSLLKEKEELVHERQQLSTWREELGVPEKKSPLEYLPFMGAGPAPVEKIREIDAKDLFKVSAEMKELLDKKESLYKSYGEIKAVDLPPAVIPITAGESSSWEQFASVQDDALRNQLVKLEQTRQKIEELQKVTEEKRNLYEKHYGRSAWLTLMQIPANIVTESAHAIDKSLDRMNPFDDSDKALEKKEMPELLEMQMHLKEQLAAQQTLVDTLTQAFDTELAVQEQKRLLAQIEQGQKNDPRELRKSIKQLERGIRIRYQEIDDHNQKQKELVKQLEGMMQASEQKLSVLGRTQKMIVAPLKGVRNFSRTFLFGAKSHDRNVTESAGNLSEDSPGHAEILDLKKEIELQSLLIEAKHVEITRLKKEVEIMKAHASLAGGYEFRSPLVKVPYVFLQEALENAKSVIPKQERQEVLIDRLDQETRDLEALKVRLKRMQSELEKRQNGSKEEGASESVSPEALQEQAKKMEQESELKREEAEHLKSELAALSSDIEIQRNIYRQEQSILLEQLDHAENSEGVEQIRQYLKVQAGPRASEKGYAGRMRDIENELAKLIQKEDRLEDKAVRILEKRVQEIDRVIPKVDSRVEKQDLLSERERMVDRLSQIQARRSFLAEELKRFQLTDTTPKV